jgi:ubiquinone/menaquinone biosynthesis C-methylase UbiE
MTNYATAWNKWFSLIESGARDVSLSMLENADIASGHHVLDVATGVGEPALTAAHRVGPEGHVLGIDISPEMLSFAQERAKKAALHNIKFEVMDANALNIPAGEFDAVLCRWGLMFVDDLVATLSQLHSVLKPGGRISISVWASADEVPSLSLAARVVHDALGLRAPNEGAKSAFALSDVHTLSKALKTAGFGQVIIKRVPVNFRFESPQDYVTYRREVSTPLVAAMAGHSEHDQALAWQAVVRSVESYRHTTGKIHMDNWAFSISATRIP